MEGTAPAAARTTGRIAGAVRGVADSDRRTLLAFAVTTVLLRLPFAGAPLGIDEGGYAYVAERWLDSSGGIYGDQWVDRPPLLILAYVLANVLGGAWALRMLGTVAAIVTVLACASTAGRVAGRSALRWSGLVATVLTSSAMLQGQTVNAELPAIAFTSVAAWCVVRAVGAARPAAWAWSVGAGVAAGSAVLVKQSFVDGFAFALGVLAVLVVAGTRGRHRAALLAAGGLVGAALVATALLVWAQVWGPGIGTLLDALYGFRLDAGRVLESSSGRELRRATLLGAVVVLCGLFALLAAASVGCVRIVGRWQPVRAGVDVLHVRAASGGVLAMGAVGLVGVFGGGSWWTHYLLQLVPAVSVGTGIVVAAGPGPSRSRIARLATRGTIGAVVVGAAAFAVASGMQATGELQRRPVVVGDWLARASRGGDTALIFWGHANVLERSGMTTPYPMTWSLPIRVRDPELDQLRGVLAGPDAPTWIVRWNPINSWDIDHDGQLRTVLDRRYERVAVVCDVPVLHLRDDALDGQLPPVPDTAACGTVAESPDGLLERIG